VGGFDRITAAELETDEAKQPPQSSDEFHALLINIFFLEMQRSAGTLISF
jgi:hypothetical protein